MVIRCFGYDLTGFVHEVFMGRLQSKRAGSAAAMVRIYLTSCLPRRSKQ